MQKFIVDVVDLSHVPIVVRGRDVQGGFTLRLFFQAKVLLGFLEITFAQNIGQCCVKQYVKSG